MLTSIKFNTEDRCLQCIYLYENWLYRKIVDKSILNVIKGCGEKGIIRELGKGLNKKQIEVALDEDISHDKIL